MNLGKLSVIAVAALAAVAIQAATVEIGTAADFVSNLSADPAGDYRLTADIDLTGAGYTTIADFSGTLDGDGKTLTGLGAQSLCTTNSGSITGLTIDGTVSAANTTWIKAGVGIFCCISFGGNFTGCVVKGYTLKLNAGSLATGFFASTVLEGSKFIRCVTDSSCEIQQNSKANSIMGCIAGKVDAIEPNGVIAVFEDCVNNATISATGDSNTSWGSGGIVGKIEGCHDASIPEVGFVRCVNNGTITTTGGNSNLGGILAHIAGGSSKDNSARARFVGCVNNGTISSSSGSSTAAGIVGWSNAAATIVMEGCVNRADITTPLFTSAGGLIGSHATYSSSYGECVFIRNSANYGAVSAKDAGGLVGKFDTNTGWKTGKLQIYNCANYGGVTATGNSGELVSYMTSDTGNSVVLEFKNCWTKTAQRYTNSSKTPVVEGVISSEDAGYTDAAAISALNDGKSAEYLTWTAGTDGRPELGLFQPSGVENTVAFFDWNGTLLKEQQVSAGEDAEPPSDPARTSFSFVGWSGKYASVTEPTIVIPIYDAQEFTVTFDSAGGTPCEPITLKYGEVLRLPVTTRTGYEFVCWSENLARREVVTCPDYNLAVRAVWRQTEGAPNQRIKVLHWQIKGTDASSRPKVVGALAAVCETNGVPDVFVLCGGENRTDIKTSLESTFPGYTFVPKGCNGSSDGIARVYGYKTDRFEEGEYTSETRVSNATTGMFSLHELGTDNYYVLFNMYSGLTKSATDYLNGFAASLTVARTKFPTATFIACGAYYDRFKDYASGFEAALATYKEKSGLVELQAGEDYQWTLYQSVYEGHALKSKTVVKFENDTASSYPGYLTVFKLGSESKGLMLLLR